VQVLEGVHLIRGGVSNVYLVRTPGGYVLVDAGTPSDPPRVLSYISQLGLEPSAIKFVLLTHSHWDHAGGLRELVLRTGARVAAHRDEVSYVRSGRGRYEGVEVDVMLEDGDEVLGLRAVHTPGHTPGSTCYLEPSRRALFVGDLVYEEGGALHEMLHKYSEDPWMNRRSVAKLLKYEFAHVLPSHGSPVLDYGREALSNLLRELGLQPEP